MQPIGHAPVLNAGLPPSPADIAYGIVDAADQLSRAVRLTPELTSVMAVHRMRPSGPPPGCPSNGCHHFWAAGVCRHGADCMFTHVHAPADWVDTRIDAKQIADIYGLASTHPDPADAPSKTKRDRGAKLPSTARKPPPEGCDPSWCYSYWNHGSCEREACKFLHVVNKRPGNKPAVGAIQAAIDPAWCGDFWKGGKCPRRNCTKLHVVDTKRATPPTLAVTPVSAVPVAAAHLTQSMTQMLLYATPPPTASPPSAATHAMPGNRHVSATNPPCPWSQRVALERPGGIHATVSFTVVPDCNMNLLAPRAAFPFGWAFYYSGDHEGALLEIPGVRSFRLRNGTCSTFVLGHHPLRPRCHHL